MTHKQHTVRIVITGPESAGKTTLANDLAGEYGIEAIKEYARDYLGQINRSYTIDDLIQIAHEQHRLLSISPTARLQICDTAFLVLKIWAEEKFKIVPDIIQQYLEDTPVALYILCKPDVPYEEDPLRENPHDRDRLYGLYRRTLDTMKTSYITVSGSHHDRLAKSIEAINYILGE